MKAIAYYRVSTAKQGSDGLGIEAQRNAVEGFCQPIESFTEVESGKRSDRPQLHAAIEACKRHGATLVIAKLDRLARNVLFMATLMDCRRGQRTGDRTRGREHRRVSQLCN
jgi:DNA invertase Pin-like site-specific DNA recombinase